MKEKERKILNKCLLSNVPSNVLNNNLEFLIKEIPDIKKMIGFLHKHPHHHLDVWEHTLLALDNSPKELDIRMALLFHDIGKPDCCTEDGDVRHFYNHASLSAYIAYITLRRLDYDNEFINDVIYLVRMHDTPLNVDDVTLDNFELEKKRLKIQYADAYAHHPDKVYKRIEILDNIASSLCYKCFNKNVRERK